MPIAGTARPGLTAYGQIPDVPDPRETARRAIDFNVGVAPELRSMVGGFFPNLPQQTEALNRLLSTTTGTPTELAPGVIAGNLANMPNLYSMVGAIDPTIGTRRGIIDEYLAGQVPEDVRNLLTQQAAERGVATGSPLSPNANAALLRSLGLTSLGLQETGMTNAEKLASQIFGEMSPFFVTPGQEAAARTGLLETGLRGSQALGEGLTRAAAPFFLSPEQQQAAEMAANLYAAAPDPTLAAMEAERLQRAAEERAAAAGRVPPPQPGAGTTPTPRPTTTTGTGTQIPIPRTPYEAPTLISPNTPVSIKPTAKTTPTTPPDWLLSETARAAQTTAARQAQIDSRARTLISQGWPRDLAYQQAQRELATGTFGGIGAGPTLTQHFGQDMLSTLDPLNLGISPFAQETGIGEMFNPASPTFAQTGGLGLTLGQPQTNWIDEWYRSLGQGDFTTPPLSLGGPSSALVGPWDQAMFSLEPGAFDVGPLSLGPPTVPTITDAPAFGPMESPQLFPTYYDEGDDWY